MIRLACPSCSKKLAVEDSSAGSVCKCPACANKFRVPEAEAPPPPPPARPAVPKKTGARESASRGSAVRRDKSATNGQALDQLEVVGDDVQVRPRRKGKSTEPQPNWVPGAALGGIVCLFLLAIGAVFFRFVAIGLIVIGLPASLSGRKWKLIGQVGIAYLLTGAAFFVLHNSNFLGPVSGPPARNASPQAVDAHCARLLKDPGKTEAGSWVGVEKPKDTAMIRGLRATIREAYDAGAAEVWLTNLQKKDETGLLSPDLVVVLPADEDARARVLAWYQRIEAGKLKAGQRYLYVDWD